MKEYNKNIRNDKSVSQEFSEEAIQTIESLMLQGKEPVPDDVNDIQSLIEYKIQ